MSSYPFAGVKKSEYAIPTVESAQTSGYAAEQFYNQINEQLFKKQGEAKPLEHEPTVFANGHVFALDTRSCASVTGSSNSSMSSESNASEADQSEQGVLFKDNKGNKYMIVHDGRLDAVKAYNDKINALAADIGIDTKDDLLENLPDHIPTANINTACSRTLVTGEEKSDTAYTAASRTMVTAELVSDPAFTAASRTMVTGEEKSADVYTAASRTMVTGEERSDFAHTACSRTLVTGEEKSDDVFTCPNAFTADEASLVDTAVSRTMVTGEERSDSVHTAASRTMVTGEEMTDPAFTARLDSRSVFTAVSNMSNMSLVDVAAE